MTRHFTRWLLGLLLFPLAACAEPADSGSTDDGLGIVEGIEYQVIRPALPTTVAPGEVEVAELFWYGCPHCYRLEPAMEQWVARLPKGVVFVRVPAQFRDTWKLHAQLYYTLQVLDLEEKLHGKFFEALHKARRPLFNLPSILAFMEENGVPRDQFLAAWDSFTVRTRMARADAFVRGSGADSVPTVVVNGKYRTNITTAGGTPEKLFAVIEHLIEKERKAAR